MALYESIYIDIPLYGGISHIYIYIMYIYTIYDPTIPFNWLDCHLIVIHAYILI